jgi:hypothetical protein
MMVKEMAEPVAAPQSVIKDLLRPLRRNMESVLTELTGEDVETETLRMCAHSVVSQLLFFGFNRLARERVFKARGRSHPPPVDELIEHITRFSLAGIRAIRDAAEGGAE